MGIIKTAMMSGVAIYGVKQLAETARSHRNDPKASLSRDGADPEYLEWLEAKRRFSSSAPPTLGRSPHDQARDLNEQEQQPLGYCAGQRQLGLAPLNDMPPSYNYSLDGESRPSQGSVNQPLEFTQRSASSFNQLDRKNGVNNGRKKSDLGSLIDQGINMLQVRRGNDQIQGADLIGKFLKK